MTSPSMQLAHVALSVTDLERANRFYIDVLGLKEVQDVGAEGLVCLDDEGAGGVLPAVYGEGGCSF